MSFHCCPQIPLLAGVGLLIFYYCYAMDTRKGSVLPQPMWGSKPPSDDYKVCPAAGGHASQQVALDVICVR